ncbi:TetR/AcrR family transcriptional regulator [Flagellimonas meishanensis]|uniref:TetR/AcrR family transcriptional regulator n=1 Tax=Flagellimonas meishanensis TaxID=2873264 RepID=UPI001CA6E345|nr:TetR/AcrR family transcriptional regulator [[Muricauda] meishanensis]
MPRTKQFDEEEVLKKAMELFWKKGFHATSIQDLVSCLGINRASLYDTFGGKDELFRRAFQEYRNSSGDKVKALLAEGETVKAGFERLFSYAIDQAEENVERKGCFVVNTTAELVPGNTAIQSILCENMEGILSIFSDYIQKGIDHGEISPSKNPKDIAIMLFTFYNGFQVISKIETNRKKLEDLVQTGISVLDD